MDVTRIPQAQILSSNGCMRKLKRKPEIGVPQIYRLLRQMVAYQANEGFMRQFARDRVSRRLIQYIPQNQIYDRIMKQAYTEHSSPSDQYIREGCLFR